ncbi:MAG: DMT family transporter [Chloroflexi bacterium]|nr:DMT family transporter [Chloroflexota bacterium]
MRQYLAALRLHPSENFLPYLALAFGVLGLGFSAIFVRWANAPGPVAGLYRVGLAAAVLALPFGRQVRRSGPLSRPHLWLAALAGVFFALDLASWNTGVLITSAANATLFGNTSPLWVSLAALLIFKETLRPAFWVGLAVTMLGAVVILGADFVAHPALGAGDLLSLLAGFFYAGFFLATERARQKLSPLVTWWVAAAASSLVLLALALLLHQPLWGYSARTYLNLIAIALVTQIGAYLCVNYALGHLPASIVSPTLLAQPVLTALLAVPLLGQPIDGAQLVGGLLVLAGIWAVHRSKQPNEGLSKVH